MYAGALKFDSIPQIGFAHHFYAENFHNTYGSRRKSIEIVYVKSGAIEAELYGEKIIISEGSIFVLFRHLPFTLRSIGNVPQSHCTVQADFEYDFNMVHENDISENNGIILPFVTPPGKDSEYIKSELYSIVSDISISREENALSSSLRFISIMQYLNKIARKNQKPINSSSSIISYNIKKYISDNLHKSITLTEIGKCMNKTPGYINHIFKETNGLTVIQYINKEKVQRITSLMHNKNLSFKEACYNVGITDISYGYRLFKKHTGITPGDFFSANIHVHK